MPARTALIYLAEKYRHETQFENYLMDMLWAPANGMQYKQAKRYSDLRQQEPKKIGDESGDEIVNNIITGIK